VARLGGHAAMTTLFVRLKLRLIRGNLRGDLGKQVGFVFSVLAAIVYALGGFTLFSLVRLAAPDTALNVGIVVFTAFTVGWAVVPLVIFGVDETLDPSRLALFPLTTRQLAVGMFAASATGPWPLATLVILAGGVAGLADGVGGVLIGLVAVVLQFALCLVTSRVLTTALSGALRSRRGRDVLAVAAVGVVLLSQLPNLLLNRGLPGDLSALLASTGEVLRWAPPGLAAHAIADGGLVGVAELVVLAGVVALLAWLWIVALQRALVMPDASNQGGGTVRRSWIDRFLPQGMLGGVVAKELKYARREPRGRVAWFTAVVVSGIIMFTLSSDKGPVGLFSAAGPACLAALMIGIQACNSFGIDGRSLWMNAVAFSSERDLRTDLAGRHLAIAVIAVPLLGVISVAAAALAGNAAWAVPAALTAWGLLGVALGVGAVASVVLPYTLPERLNAFSGAAPGQGPLAFGSATAGFLVTSTLALPIVLPVLLGFAWVSVVAVPYGLVVAWAGRRTAGLVGFARMPSILVAVSRPA
jgi:ABC-2 type transport system permease protein